MYSYICICFVIYIYAYIYTAIYVMYIYATLYVYVHISRTRGWTALPPIPCTHEHVDGPTNTWMDRAASNPVEHEVEVPPQTPTLVGGPEGTQGYTAEEQPIDCANEWARGQVIVSVARRLFGEELYICPQACDSVPFARRLVVVPKLGRQLL